MKSLMRLDPFRMMRRWDPFEELHAMQREMDRIFDRFLGAEKTGREELAGFWTPTVESYTKEGKLVIKAELPGIDAKDVDVSVTERELVIKGERKAEKEEKEKDYAYREIAYGSFERRFLLPEGVKTEELKAKFTNGILEIAVPVPALPKAKKILVETKDVKQIEEQPKIKKVA
jgi:HSP20 family protein